MRGRMQERATPCTGWTVVSDKNPDGRGLGGLGGWSDEEGMMSRTRIERLGWSRKAEARTHQQTAAYLTPGRQR